MEQYRINDLERLSGVKAHTIRIWEKRYKLISPSRTSTNRRFYDNVQLRKLLNVATLLSHGYKISVVAALSDEELKSLIEELHQSSSEDGVYISYINDLTNAMVLFDESSFEHIFSEVTKRFGFFEGMINVYYPFLDKTGMMWRVSKSRPVQEHFASCVLRKKIIAATDSLPMPSKPVKKFILFLPPKEWHEIGLLFANYILRAKGHAVIYLGQNVPYIDIRDIFAATKPDYLLTFFISPRPKEELNFELNQLVQFSPGATVLFSGDREMLENTEFLPSLKHLKGVHELLAIL